MNQTEKDILNDELPTLINEISDPQLLADYIKVFNPVDKDKIKSDNTNHGPTQAVHTLINRLKKRGQNAFREFLYALEILKYDTTRTRILSRAEARGLRVHEVAESAPVQGINVTVMFL